LKRWTKEEVQFIRDNINVYDNYELAEKLNCTYGQVKAKLSNMRLKRDDPRFRWNALNKRVTKIKGWKLDYLKDHINDKTMDELIEILDVSGSTIRSAMRKNGIRLSDEVYKKRVAITRFKKGHVPANKGKKMTDELRERVKHTFFKKGNQPSNTKYDGAISARRDSKGHWYKHIRIAKGKWVLLHRYLWEKAFGEIPPKHLLSFKNGNSLDVRLENLELISMRENSRRNRNRKKAAETMRKQWASGERYNNDNWIATLLSRKNKKLRDEIKKHPELIELKREQLKLRRAINESKSD
jgi:DNA-binding CsgD family transcriptional regulator